MEIEREGEKRGRNTERGRDRKREIESEKKLVGKV